MRRDWHAMKSFIILAVGAGIVIAAIFRPPASPTISAQATPLTHRALAHTRSPERRLVVYVAGAVEKPGLYRLAPGSRAVDGVKLAGGFRPDADPAGVNLAAPLEDGMEIVTPLLGRRRPASQGIRRSSHRRTGKRKESATAALQADARIDLNAADEAALQQLPGIGAEMAQRIVRFREANGTFASLDELADVAGMTPRRMEALLPYLRLGQ
ncbi:MAG: helix-hairpin-helix domain-containing protein [Vulcanimicrobiaceae bacterium]